MSTLYNFGGASGANLQRGVAFVRKVEALVAELGRTWTIEIKLPGGPRTPPRTLHPRKGPPPTQPTVAQVALWQVTGTRKMPARNMFEINDFARTQLGQRLAQRFTPQVLDGGAWRHVPAFRVESRDTTGSGGNVCAFNACGLVLLKNFSAPACTL